MKKNILFSVILVTGFSSVSLAENCFKVNIKQKIDTEKCTPVPVVLTVFECGTPDKIVEEKTVDADVNCKASPLQLKMKYQNQTLISETEPAAGWGGINFRVVKTSAVGGSAPAKPVASPAPSVAATTPAPKAKLAAATSPTIQAKSKPAKNSAADKNPRKVLAEEAVQTRAESATESAKIKDAATGEVAPAQPPGKIEIAPVDKVVDQQTQTVKEIPVNFKVSGFAWIEHEDTRNFGYDGASLVPNFDASAPNSQQTLATLFSNLQLDISKDKTNFTTVLEIGELVNGEPISGGSQGGRKAVFELRNAYLTHAVDPRWTVKAGLFPLSSDPNGFIIADHFTAAILDHQQPGIAASLWTAKGAANKPGLPNDPAVANNADQSWGVSAQPTFGERSKLTAYAVLRRSGEELFDSGTAANVKGRTQKTWYGATFDHTFNDRFSAQATGILNNTKFAGNDNGPTESYKSHLLDAKFVAAWKDQGFGLLFEVLATSGSSGAVGAGNVGIVGQRRGFNSVGPAYLFTIATSDGADDAPGTAKESTIASLAQAEGLQIALVKASQSFTEKLSGFVRAGTLRTSAASTTGSTYFGDELDFNLAYELSPGTVVQADYGYFKPGAFFEKKDPAHLFTTRVKFSF